MNIYNQVLNSSVTFQRRHISGLTPTPVTPKLTEIPLDAPGNTSIIMARNAEEDALKYRATDKKRSLEELAFARKYRQKAIELSGNKNLAPVMTEAELFLKGTMVGEKLSKLKLGCLVKLLAKIF